MKKNIVLVVLLAITFSSIANDDKEFISREKAFLGVAYKLTDTKDFKYKTAGFGYQIIRVLKDTAADVIGLESGDIIIGFDKQDLTKLAEDKRHIFFSKYIKSKNVGDEFNITILRQKTTILQGTNTKISDITTLKQAIDNQGSEQLLNFSIDKLVKILKLSAKLGSRATIDEKDLPENNSLFPQYEHLSSTYTKLVSRTILHYNLVDDYNDLLQRYKKNELWEQGFRLNLFRYLHREPLKFTPVIDTRLEYLSQKAKTETNNLIQLAGSWIDISTNHTTITYPKTKDKNLHFNFIINTLNQAELLRQKAFAKLSKEDIIYLKNELPKLMARFNKSFYIDRPKYKKDQKNNIKIIELTKKVNFNALLSSANLLMGLTNKKYLNTLKTIIAKDNKNIELNSNAGAILLGGFGNNRYQKSYALIIDYTGNDIYSGASSIANDSISIIIDLAGDDEYQHTRKYSQGSAFFGIGILFENSGDDIYTANNYTQGFSLLGVGQLIDISGNDKYFSRQFSQGTSFWGIAILLDGKGNDNYQANLYAQGLGGVKGFGMLIDNDGDDFYFATGSDESSYGVSGIFKSISQGAGIGFRGYASGGIGLLLDGGGKDIFRAGNFSQGMGYFYGLGIIKNYGKDDDIYIASRYSQGTAAHSAMGILIDDGGNDSYRSLAQVSQSAAWDISLAALWDKSGNDTYIGSNAFSSHNGFSLFIDENGVDSYNHISGGEINDYHGGSSFGIFIDAGGNNDNYPANYKNNASTVTKKYRIFLDL